METTDRPARRARFRGRLVAAGLCTMLSVVILPAVAAVALCAWTGIGAARRRRWWVVGAAAALFVAATAGGLVGLVVLRRQAYRMGLSVHASALVQAVRWAGNETRTPPLTLDEVRQKGAMVPTAYVLSDGDPCTRPHYLPVSEWDGRTPVIIAVTARSPKYPDMERAYIRVFDPAMDPDRESWEWIAYGLATPAALRGLLAEDDRTRARLGEPRRWAEVEGLWDVPGAK